MACMKHEAARSINDSATMEAGFFYVHMQLHQRCDVRAAAADSVASFMAVLRRTLCKMRGARQHLTCLRPFWRAMLLSSSSSSSLGKILAFHNVRETNEKSWRHTHTHSWALWQSERAHHKRRDKILKLSRTCEMQDDDGKNLHKSNLQCRRDFERVLFLSSKKIYIHHAMPCCTMNGCLSFCGWRKRDPKQTGICARVSTPFSTTHR